MLSTILFRILAFPFVVVLGFLGAMRLWCYFIWDFVRYGGEFVTFTKYSRTTIKNLLVLIEGKVDDGWKEIEKELDNEEES